MSIFTDLSPPDLICWDAINDRASCGEHTAVALTVTKFMCIFVSLVVLPCGYVVCKFVTVVSSKVFAVVLEVGSSTYLTQS